MVIDLYYQYLTLVKYQQVKYLARKYYTLEIRLYLIFQMNQKVGHLLRHGVWLLKQRKKILCIELIP